MQKGYQKLIEWYGRKKAALQAVMATPNQALVQGLKSGWMPF